MGIKIQSDWRQQVTVWTLAGMLAGLFFSRALLSVGMLLFLAATFGHAGVLKQAAACFRNKWLAALTLLFFVPAISGLWSSDKEAWLNVMRIKLPLLFFPLAFAGSWQLNERHWKRLFLFFVVLVGAGCCWSLAQYVTHMGNINESYLRAKSIPTPFENDHVRFSWVVSVAAAAAFWAAHQTQEKSTRMWLLIAAFFLAVYLHILSARTGLLCFYFFLLFFIAHLFYRSEKKGLLVVAAFFLLPFIACFTLPTFQNRAAYILYDVSFIKTGTYLPGGNDGARLSSLKAGWHILLKNPFGVGSGNVEKEAGKWYAAHLPHMIDGDKLLPSSEWLMYGGFAGWPGFILFTLVMWVPLVLPVRKNRWVWLALNGMAALSFLFDIGLEVQFGVFAYIFIILCFWKYLQKQNEICDCP